MKKLSFYLKLLVNWLLIGVIGAFILKISGVSKMILIYFNLMEVNSSEHENNTILIFTAIASILALVYVSWLIIKFRKVIYTTRTNSFFSEKKRRFLVLLVTVLSIILL